MVVVVVVVAVVNGDESQIIYETKIPITLINFNINFFSFLL